MSYLLTLPLPLNKSSKGKQIGKMLKLLLRYFLSRTQSSPNETSELLSKSYCSALLSALLKIIYDASKRCQIAWMFKSFLKNFTRRDFTGRKVL